jgi:hypothetical protein
MPSRKNPKTSHARNMARAGQTSKEIVTICPAPVSKILSIKRSSRPVYRSLPNGDIEVTHREYVQDVNTTNLFTATQLAINPGRSTMFPWLSNLALNYERYRFEKLEFEWRTGQPTTSPGRVGLYVDYDMADPAPTTKAQAYTSRGYVDGPVWENLKYRADKEDLHRLKEFYVYDGIADAAHAQDLVDLGNLTIVTAMDSSPASPGAELFVDYVVRLINPQARAAPRVIEPETEDVVLTAPSTNFFGTLAEFIAGTSLASDPIASWASDTAIQFAESFYGTLTVTGNGVDVAPGAQFNDLGTGSTVTMIEQVSATGDGTTFSLVYVISALANQYFTMVNILTWVGALTNIRVLLSTSKPTVHEH